VAAALEAFRDVRLRYSTGLSSEVDVSVTQEQLIDSLVRRLNATVDVNITYARLLRELLPVPRDPAQPVQPQLQLSPQARSSSPPLSGARHGLCPAATPSRRAQRPAHLAGRHPGQLHPAVGRA
jgi:hypothetical protein